MTNDDKRTQIMPTFVFIPSWAYISLDEKGISKEQIQKIISEAL